MNFWKAFVAVLAVWGTIMLVVVANGGLATYLNGVPVTIIVAIFAPPLLTLLLLRASARFRDAVRLIDVQRATVLQQFRVAGFALLVLYSIGEVPALFALFAGLGDLFIALTAPFVAFAVRIRGVFIGWHVLGILDLVGAVTLGLLQSSAPLGVLATDVPTTIMASFPIGIIPGFFVPAAFSLHIMTIYAARTRTFPGDLPHETRMLKPQRSAG